MSNTADATAPEPKDSLESLLLDFRSAFAKHGQGRMFVLVLPMPEGSKSVSPPPEFTSREFRQAYGCWYGLGEIGIQRGDKTVWHWCMLYSGSRELVDSFRELAARAGAALSSQSIRGLGVANLREPGPLWAMFVAERTRSQGFITDKDGYSLLGNLFAASARAIEIEFDHLRAIRAAQTSAGAEPPPLGTGGLPGGVPRILLLASNPLSTTRLRLDQEIRSISEGLKRCNLRDRFELVPQLAVRVEDLRRNLLDVRPDIVHFAGHGDGPNGIVVEGAQGEACQVANDALAELFGLCREHVECVVFNACYSDSQATAVVQHIPYVIGMAHGISDEAAVEFSIGFYDALGAGRPIEDAFRFGCNAIALKGISESLTPVLKKRN